MAFLPNSHLAVVEKEKVTDYLLSSTHAAGRSKAAFLQRFGFDASAWEMLRGALLRQAATAEVATVTETIFGTKYIIESGLDAPDGRRPRIRSVWFISSEQQAPRLVTIIPLPGGKE